MKNFYFLIAFLMGAISFGQTSDIYFSMYGEGSGNNKFLEIYNGTGATVNLDNYAFPNVSNAPTTPGEYEFWNTFPTGATIADGDVYVIAHPSADAAILAVADATFPYLSNGDDGFALVANDGTWNDADMDGNIDAGEMTGFTVLDWLGDFQGDPGVGWDVAGITTATANHTLTRKASVCGPNNNWAASAGTDTASSEWEVTDIDTGWADLGAYTGCVSDPILTIASPSDMMVFPAGTTSVNVAIAVQNFVVDQLPANGGSGDGHIHWSLNGNGQPMKYDTADETITTMDGQSYTVYMQLVDNTHTPLNPAVEATVTFSVAYPCDLVLGAENATCETETNGTDNYTATIDFTGGGTSTYTINTGGVGTVAGDNPSSVANGTISITGIPEGTNITVNIIGDVANSSCDLSTTINSPVCVGTLTCPAVGAIIVTEIMKNPNVVADGAGEYFEVYNTTGADIDMQGWDITDAGGESHTIAASLVVPAMGYAVLGINSDSATNGGVTVDYQYSSFNLANGDDEVQLECSGTIIDAVAYTDADFPDTTGVAMELDINSLDSVSNDTGANWGDATNNIGSGDLGTPGAANDFSLGVTGFNANKFNLYPNPVSNGLVNISATNTSEIAVTVYNLLGKQVLATTVTNNQINVSTLQTGVYLVKLTQNNATVTKKLVIK